MDETFKRHVIAELEQLLQFRGDDQFEIWQTQTARTKLALLHKAVPACVKKDENHDALELDHTTLFEDSTRYTKERVPIFTSKKIHTWSQGTSRVDQALASYTNDLQLVDVDDGGWSANEPSAVRKTLRDVKKRFQDSNTPPSPWNLLDMRIPFPNVEIPWTDEDSSLLRDIREHVLSPGHAGRQLFRLKIAKIGKK
ncbi:hypothetical protein SLS54_009588 [Diplodia seriata]